MIGEQLGSYRLLKLLGEGGMGRVFLAEHVGMNDYWAVKLLAEEYAQKPEIVARFLDEARAAARVRHFNLVRVVHVERTASGVCFMVLEYLEGVTLANHIATHGPATPERVIDLTCPIADALRELHAHDIIHRDVKPDNVMLVTRFGVRDVPVLLDLGVAHLGKLATGPGTQAGTLIGTPTYMAPEQLLGEPVGPAADLFSLGVLVYELATGGHFPWQHDGETRRDYFHTTSTQLFHRQRTERATDPRHHVPAMSDAFAKALLAPLELDAARRPTDERAYLVALAQAVPGDEVHADGLQIIRDRAPRLLSFEDARSTIRVQAPAILSTPGSEAKYVLGEKLGAGGMAEVFAAQTLGVAGFERSVAIKRVLPELSAQPEFAAMFIAEARLASRLSHANIITVTDFREDEEGRLFLVMEYVDGKDLATVVECGPLPVALILYVIGEALGGLDYAHGCVDPVTGSTGVIHRDISPHNILVSRQGDVKIGDFGLSRAADHAGQARSTTIRGKTSYMAPEQIARDPLDRRADLFAIGIVLWELLANAQLFGGSQSEAMAQVLFKDIARPSAIAPEIPPDVEAVAMRLLEREPGARYQTAAAARAALRRCRDNRLESRDELAQLMRTRFPRPGEGMVTRTLDRVPAPSTLRSVASQAVPRGDTRRSPTGVLAAASVTVFALAAGGVFAGFRALHHPPSPSGGARSAVVADASAAQAAQIDAPRPPVDAPLPPIDAPRIDAPAVIPRPHHSVPPSVAAEPGELVIVVKPWATIKLDGKPIGTTPYRDTVASGRHRVELTNEDVGRDEPLTITVEPNKTTKIERQWQ